MPEKGWVPDMNRSRVRITSLLLAAVLALMLCMTAWAADDTRRSPSFVVENGDKLLVGDVFNKVLWELDGSRYTTYAGRIVGYNAAGEPVGLVADGDAKSACFSEPWGAAPYRDGWAVTDTAANAIRYLAGGKVTTVFGASTVGRKNAFLKRPTGIASDGRGGLYIADTGNDRVCYLNKEGVMSVPLTELTEPTGLCYADGALYVAETGKNRILRFAAGETEVLAGTLVLEDSEYIGGYVNGRAAKARFDHPQGIAVGRDGTVYVADTDNHAIRMLRGGRVYTLASEKDGLMSPRGLLVKGDTLYVADTFSGKVFSFSLKNEVFTDVPADAWYAAALQEVRYCGIINGVGNSRFAPENKATNAEFAVMLSRMNLFLDGADVIDGDMKFSDVADSAWYAPYVRWAGDNGLMGTANGAFRPNELITPEQMLLVLYRYDRSLAASGASAQNATAEEAVRWAKSKKLTDGIADFEAALRRPIDRATAAALFAAYLKNCR